MKDNKNAVKESLKLFRKTFLEKMWLLEFVCLYTLEGIIIIIIILEFVNKSRYHIG